MSDLKLLYFKGCPHVEKLRNALINGKHKFEEIRQDLLTEAHPLKNFSSPTLLQESEIIFGADSTAGSSCSIDTFSAKEFKFRLSAASNNKKTKLFASSGSLGSILTVILCPVCKPALAVFLSSIGLGIVVNAIFLKWLLVVFLFVSTAGLFWSYLKVHQRIAPVIWGLLMAICLYLGRYVYFNYEVNTTLTYGGIAGLIIVSIWKMTLKKPASCGSCQKGIS